MKLCLLVARTGRRVLAHQPFFCGAGILEESPPVLCWNLQLVDVRITANTPNYIIRSCKFFTYLEST